MIPDVTIKIMIIRDQNWRILRSTAANGAWNMAVDESLLESVTVRESPPVFRLYDWSPACLSLGYGQFFSDVDESLLKANGWDVVRRPTGGKAILHIDEITYSVCAAADHPLMAAGILQSYKTISLALLRGLEHLAVAAKHEERYDLPPDSDPKGPVCFEVPSNWEITFEGKKLIGSAQVRRSGGVLQHGTLPLHGDLARITQCLVFDNEEDRQDAAARIPARATTVEYAIGKRVTWEEAAAALETGLREELGIQFECSELTMNEEKRARAHVNEKYGNPSWTMRR